MRKRVLATIAASSMLSGCVAPMIAAAALEGGMFAGNNALSKGIMNKEERQVATAQAIGGDINYRFIKVSDVTSVGDMINWTATTPDGLYACSMSKGRTQAVCRKQ